MGILNIAKSNRNRMMRIERSQEEQETLKEQKGVLIKAMERSNIKLSKREKEEALNPDRIKYHN